MSDPGFAPPTGDPSVLPAGAKLERVFDRACFLTEGVSVSPDDGMVYFCDITFTPLCKDPSGKYPGAGKTGDRFSLAKRHGSRDEIRCRRQSHHRRRQ
jgi:hypothetical protein